MLKTDTENQAFLFPGTSVPLCGCEVAFFNRHRTIVELLLDNASKKATTDLKTIFLEKKVEELNECDNQLFTFAFSCGQHDAYVNAGYKPTVVAGYSMGIYAALYASGVLSFSHCIDLIVNAYKIMNTLVPQDFYRMGAIIGLSLDEIEQLIARSASTVCIVNSNNDTCHIIAGKHEEVRQVIDTGIVNGALKAIELTARIPYHHMIYMEKASILIRQHLDRLEWRMPRYPIISTIDQKILKTPNEFKELVAKNLSSPINWTKVMKLLVEKKYSTFFECGPGISLTQNGRFISSDIRFVNVKNSLQRVGV